jgi:hypothetical protein
VEEIGREPYFFAPKAEEAPLLPSAEPPNPIARLAAPEPHIEAAPKNVDTFAHDSLMYRLMPSGTYAAVTAKGEPASVASVERVSENGLKYKNEDYKDHILERNGTNYSPNSIFRFRGDVETGKIEGNLYFKFDMNSKYSDAENQKNKDSGENREAYIEAFKQNILKVWNGKVIKYKEKRTPMKNATGSDLKIDLSTFVFTVVPKDFNEKNIPDKTYLFRVGQGSPDVKASISHVNRAKRTGYMYESDWLPSKRSDDKFGFASFVAAHEFGHLFGLQDRYVEGLSLKHPTSKKEKLYTRFAVPLVITNKDKIDKDYVWNDNLYSNATETVTDFQIRVFFGLEDEAAYPKVYLLHFRSLKQITGAWIPDELAYDAMEVEKISPDKNSVVLKPVFNKNFTPSKKQNILDRWFINSKHKGKLAPEAGGEEMWTSFWTKEINELEGQDE